MHEPGEGSLLACFDGGDHDGGGGDGDGGGGDGGDGGGDGGDE